MMTAVATFEAVADEYDAARPSHPNAVFDVLGPLDGLRMLDVGAGTGIATRELVIRRARVTALDPGREVLGRAPAHTSGLDAAVADGSSLPTDSHGSTPTGPPSITHASGTHRGQRDTDWGLTVAAPGMFEVGERLTVHWVREVSVDEWMTDQSSHSYVPAGPLHVPYETWQWVASRIRDIRRRCQPLPSVHGS